MSDSILFPIVLIGLVLWVLTYVAEIIYNIYLKRKRRAAIERRLTGLGYDPKEHV